MALHDHGMPYKAIDRHTWPYMALHNHGMPYMAIDRHAWPYMIISVNCHGRIAEAIPYSSAARIPPGLARRSLKAFYT